MSEVSSMKDAVRQYWDAKPCGITNSTTRPGSRAFYAEIETHRYREEFHIPEVAEFAAHRDKRMLEVGCGLGTDGRQFARNGAQYTGCDLSVQSLALARQGFRVSDLRGQFLCADAERLPFPDESFALLYSHGVLHHSPDTARAIREVHRVLRRGGEAIVMLYAREAFAYVIGAQTIGRARLELFRRRLGRKRFNRLVGLPPQHSGWLPDWVVINNSTDGLGNPLSQLFTRQDLERMFAQFSDVHLEKHYFPRRKIPLLGPRLPRPVAYRLGRMVGSFWYVKATK
jgi:SAM-dependent methyltransferase